MPTLRKAGLVKHEREKTTEEAIELLKILENELKDKKFFGGETIGFVDIACNFSHFNFKMTNFLTGPIRNAKKTITLEIKFIFYYLY